MRLSRHINFLVLLLLGVSISAHGATWSRVVDGPFTVFTQGDPAQATALMHSFAQLRNALSQVSPLHATASENLKIIVFQSEKEFNRFRLNPGSCAFYQQTSRGEYVVLQDQDTRRREVSTHEFTHFVVAHSGFTLPLWLNEGLADFYSTFRINGDGDYVTFGRSVSGRLAVLQNSTWLPLNNLFDVSPASPYYSNPERMLLFYSESWALAHMLIAAPEYADRFPNFLRSVSESHNTSESLRAVYNKSLAQIKDDLHEYLDRQHLPLIEAHLASVYSPIAAYSVASVSDAEMEITLSDLSVTHPDAQADLQTRLTVAASQLPNNAEAAEALGYLALRQGKSSEARAQFQLAVDRHSSNPNTMFYLAHLNHAAGSPSSQVVPLLERALELNPELSDARLELALVATADGNFDQALEALRKLTKPRAENAYAIAYTEAYCFAHIEDLSAARAAARRAQTLAANDRDRAEVSELLEYIEQPATGDSK